MFCSDDVTVLFPSVPVDPALNIIQGLLKKDTSLDNRTVLQVQNIIQLLGFCLYNSHFFFHGQFYEQVEGAAMGSPISPIVANFYMGSFERIALSTATTPRLWLSIWMTPLSSNRKNTNRASWSISIMWTLP